jgi:recombination DNA repair RAD52 pathway protein
MSNLTWLLAPEQIRALMGPLNAARVAHRNQGGAQLSYLEAYDVRATLIRVFGFGNFSVEIIDSKVLRGDLRERENARPIWDVTMQATVRLTIHATSATYTESAISMQSNPDFGEAADFAIKTAESDALKRAATNLGTQFGLGLYDNGSTREIVRVLFEPGQRDALGQPAPATPEQAAALARSVGAANGQQEPAQPAQDPTQPSVTDHSDRVPAQEVQP